MVFVVDDVGACCDVMKSAAIGFQLLEAARFMMDKALLNSSERKEREGARVLFGCALQKGRGWYWGQTNLGSKAVRVNCPETYSSSPCTTY